MGREYLERCIQSGMSLPEIARDAGKAPGTVGYWVKRHGLTANGSARFSPGKGLTVEPLRSLVFEGKTLGQIAHELEVGVNTVRYWIERHGLPSPREVRRENRTARLAAGDTRTVRSCVRHGETEWVLDASGSWRCRKCRQEAVVRRRRRVKRILVEEAGGRCSVCGYDTFVGALHFHHLDPGEKRFGLSQKGHVVRLEVARQEAAKCVLLCANCHAELEAGLIDSPSVQPPPGF